MVARSRRATRAAAGVARRAPTSKGGAFLADVQAVRLLTETLAFTQRSPPPRLTQATAWEEIENRATLTLMRPGDLRIRIDLRRRGIGNWVLGTGNWELGTRKRKRGRWLDRVDTGTCLPRRMSFANSQFPSLPRVA